MAIHAEVADPLDGVDAVIEVNKVLVVHGNLKPMVLHQDHDLKWNVCREGEVTLVFLLGSPTAAGFVGSHHLVVAVGVVEADIEGQGHIMVVDAMASTQKIHVESILACGNPGDHELTSRVHLPVNWNVEWNIWVGNHVKEGYSIDGRVAFNVKMAD